MLDAHGLVLKDVVLQKHGQAITASAGVTGSAIAAVLPVNLNIADPESGSGGLVVRAHIRVLGQQINATAGVVAEHGNIVLHPLESGIASLLDSIDITLFHSPIVWVDGVAVAGRGGTYRLTVAGHYV